ncbi:MAG: alkaline phosphatase family protein [Leptolyngbyaceae cyanobacterium HOT.MB2.61]|jgi:predicted AlkP superfamily phosphohydrolase/phosphomutase|nr:alkaline phosphatase family protein [Leptolyngbyaceae cyanobacterium HOT.MB2.61]
MNKPVIAIGLDAADPALLEKWMSQGYLKTMRRLKESGAYGRLKTFDFYRAETPWTTFLTGCSPNTTGYWSPIKYHGHNYAVEEIESYKFEEYRPFYALADNRRVVVVDVPQAPVLEGINGVQVSAWGAHSPQTPSESSPKELFQELVARHGEHPLLRKDEANILDLPDLQRLQRGMETGIARRAKICCDLLEREPWDLFLTVFGEAHVVGHYCWHMMHPSDHPLYKQMGAQYSGDMMLEVFEAMDRAIAEILEKAPEDAYVVLFSAHGMGANIMDIPSMILLPEFLFRLNFPGKMGLAPGKVGSPLKPPITGQHPRKEGWASALWNTKYERNPLKSFLRQNLPGKYFNRIEPLFGKSLEPGPMSPFKLFYQGQPQCFQPAVWYKHLWPQMKAFAIPTFSEGYIRINLQGREPSGIVPPSEYNSLCDEIIEKLYRLRDARTGQPMVKGVLRTRKSAADQDPKLPDADIVVTWQEECVTDTVDSPDVGRIGPVPYTRTGSHRADGFLAIQGPGIEPGKKLPNGHSLDLAPTILSLMDIAIPQHFEGKPLAQPPSMVPAS